MEAPEVARAIVAGMSTATALGLEAGDAVVLHNSNRLAVRLLPCDVLARVAPVEYQAGFEFEVEVAQKLGETPCPVAELEPRVEPLVYVRGAFAVTFWTYYAAAARDVAPVEYARALERLHAGMRRVEVTAPRFTERAAEAQRLVDDPSLTPELPDVDRAFLSNTLRTLSLAVDGHAAREQLLHGEPHPGNLLSTRRGPLFVDLETCCRGPVEFDVAHAPDEVSGAYPLLNPDLLRQCRVLALAIATAWRWDRRDQLPNGRQLGIEWIARIQAALRTYGLDAGA